MNEELELKDLTARVIAAGGRAGRKAGNFVFDYSEGEGCKRGDEHYAVEGVYFWMSDSRKRVSSWLDFNAFKVRRCRHNANQRNYALSNPDKVKQYNSNWSKSNPEKLSQYQRAYYVKNKKTVGLKNKRWRASNPERASFLSASNYLKNRRKFLDRQKQYRENNRDKVVAKSARRRAREREAVDPSANKLVIDSRYAAARYLRMVTGGEWEIDHTLPYDNGGKHHENNLQVVPMIWNRGKGARHNDRWLEDTDLYRYATAVEKRFEREAIAAQGN